MPSDVMTFEIAFLAETHPTNVTSKIFLSRMSGKMNFQIMEFSEGFWAVGTSVFVVQFVGFWGPMFHWH